MKCKLRINKGVSDLDIGLPWRVWRAWDEWLNSIESIVDTDH